MNRTNVSRRIIPIAFSHNITEQKTCQHNTFAKEHEDLLIVFVTRVALKDCSLAFINLNVLCAIVVIAFQAFASTQFPKFLFQITHESYSIMTGYISIKLTNGMRRR
jgi:hypothetical protein